MSTAPRATPVGDLLRRWRARRGLSQLELAVEAGISQRHLSFLEVGRATPSRKMVLQLAAALALSIHRDLGLGRVMTEKSAPELGQ